MKYFKPNTITFSRDRIMEEVNDERADNGKAPLDAENFTDKICQQYADEMGKALWNTAGEAMADSHIGVITDIANMMK